MLSNKNLLQHWVNTVRCGGALLMSYLTGKRIVEAAVDPLESILIAQLVQAR